MKRVSVALTLGLSIAATQGCMTESADTMDVGSADDAVCASYTYGSTFAGLISGMAREIGELHPTKYLVKQNDMYGSGKHAIVLTQAAKDKCNARGFAPDCPQTSLLLAYQDPGINAPGLVPITVFNAEDYRSNTVSKLQDQVNFENSRAINNQCMPPAHTLTESFSYNGETWPKPAECGVEYRFEVSFGGGGGMADITREAESYNALNRNGSQHNWTNSGGSMSIGPDWAYTWTANIPTTSPNLSYTINFPAAGSYKVWLRGMGANGNNDSAYVGVDNVTNGALVDLPENSQYGWAAGDISVSSAGNHNVQVFAREDGFNLDKIVINQSSTPPSGSTPGCTTPADLALRINQFSVPNVNFSSDATGMRCDPDPDTDPNAGGSGSGSLECGAVPTGGSDKQQIAYKAEKDGACCWQNYNQKVYKKYKTYYLLCQNP